MIIFIIESPNPNDLLEGINEKGSLEHMCRMFDHKTSSFTTYSQEDLQKIIKYISNIELKENDLLCLHFSCHGNDKGVKMGGDFIDWIGFTKLLIPILKNMNIGHRTLITISACGANGQQITEIINEMVSEITVPVKPPHYFFVYNQETVAWRDALLCWTILYHQLAKMVTISKVQIQGVIKRMSEANFGEIKYFRWEPKRRKYLRFSIN